MLRQVKQVVLLSRSCLPNRGKMVRRLPSLIHQDTRPLHQCVRGAFCHRDIDDLGRSGRWRVKAFRLLKPSTTQKQLTFQSVVATRLINQVPTRTRYRWTAEHGVMSTAWGEILNLLKSQLNLNCNIKELLKQPSTCNWTK